MVNYEIELTVDLVQVKQSNLLGAITLAPRVFGTVGAVDIHVLSPLLP